MTALEEQLTSLMLLEFRSRRLKTRIRKPRVLLGCSYKKYLAKHLGVTDKNVELDHIIPLSRYDLAHPYDLVRAFNWRNLQLRTGPNERLPNNATLLSLRHCWPYSWWAPDHEQPDDLKSGDRVPLDLARFVCV